MAIYHHSVKIIGMSSGTSAVAASAYRAGESVKNEKTGEIHDYSKKKGVVYSEIILPKNAPKWMENRSKLWSELEKKDDRINSQFCREINIALPVELTQQQNIRLTKYYVEYFTEQGLACDVAIHYPKPKKIRIPYIAKPENPHAHIVVGLRYVTPEGWGEKDRANNDRKNLKKMRERWEKCENTALSYHKLITQVSCETLEKQGVSDRMPEHHLGSKRAAMVAKGKPIKGGKVHIIPDMDLMENESTMTVEDKKKELEYMKIHLSILKKDVPELIEMAKHIDQMGRSKHAKTINFMEARWIENGQKGSVFDSVSHTNTVKPNGVPGRTIKPPTKGQGR